jgi:hypothetical protein
LQRGINLDARPNGNRHRKARIPSRALGHSGDLASPSRRRSGSAEQHRELVSCGTQAMNKKKRSTWAHSDRVSVTLATLKASR